MKKGRMMRKKTHMSKKNGENKRTCRDSWGDEVEGESQNTHLFENAIITANALYVN